MNVEYDAVAQILIRAAEEVGANRKQSIRSAIYAAAKKLFDQHDQNYEQYVHRTHGTILTLYGRGVHDSFIYNGGFQAGFWLSGTQKAHMQDALILAYEYCVTDLGAERDPFYEVLQWAEWPEVPPPVEVGRD